MSKVAAKIRNWLGFDVVDDEEIDDIEFEEEQELETIATREEKRRERKSQGKVVDLPISSNRSKLIVYRPVSYEDTMSIIDNLKSRKPIILNMENIEIDVAQRILDFMSGACSAMGGDIRKVSAKIFAVVPADYEIVGNSDGFKE
ncbi:MAG: cell division protein SepF [Clostridia bacterium]|nr:cell division protein SepF [Clostridia bacterium]MBR3459604.1 cell division protein SepF [Clostridia bacterium]MBR5713897.1 cell division protein SepF [Clostridia bacterium]